MHFITANTLIGLNLPLITLVGIARRQRRKILTWTQTRIQKAESLSDYAPEDLSVAT
jgi:hypothetical protein